MTWLEEFKEWYFKDPFWNTICILVILSMCNCTAHDMYKVWVK